jgi:hypothetical protein
MASDDIRWRDTHNVLTHHVRYQVAVAKQCEWYGNELADAGNRKAHYHRCDANEHWAQAVSILLQALAR